MAGLSPDVAAIHLGRMSPPASCNLPGRLIRKRIAGLSPDTPSLFGLAPGGVYRAVAVAGDAVGSYPTLSPLPRHPLRPALLEHGPEKLTDFSEIMRSKKDAARRKTGRSAFCGTFPGVAPAGHYPAPCFPGARTFLTCRLSAYDKRGCPAN
ncbi:hypothetical protein PPNSA23_24360 [Phyllobacterium phragmitis]|uniref:Uncharacterized protein n=1 Tax=Phyllobacterium phragmitis TaxID=2670329 RepID=A0ABQ0H0S8_9HYPH